MRNNLEHFGDDAFNPLNTGFIFTRGQFWPSGIVMACVCVCVRMCVNHLLVRAITQDPFKLGSPNWTKDAKVLG